MVIGHFALVFAAAFAGAAFYINFAEQPARASLNDTNFLKQWKVSYPAGFIMQSSLAVVSGVLGLLAALLTNDWRWAIGAVLILANWPFTLMAIMPTNNKLKTIADADAGPASRAMLESWANLHAVRTALGTTAPLAYIWALN